MSTAHKGSILPIKDVIIPVPQGGIYFPFDYHAGSSQLLMPNSGGVYTLRPDGKYGGAIAIDEATTNLMDPDANLVPWTGTTISRSLVTSGQFEGWYKVDITRVGTGYHICSVPYINCTAGTAYTFSIEFYAPNNDITLKIDGNLGYNMDYVNGYRYVKTITPASAYSGGHWWYHKTITDAATTTCFYYRYVQAEQKAFATSFVNGSRNAGIIRYDPSILDITHGTVAMWIIPEKLLNGSATIFFEANAGTSNQNQIQIWQEGSAWKCGIICNGESGGPSTRGEVVDNWPANVPIFVALTWENVNSGSANAKVAFYKNGEYLFGRDNVALNLTPLTFLAIGSRATGASYNANSLIDDLIMLPYAATPDEIRSWYHKDRPFYDPYDYTLIVR